MFQGQEKVILNDEEGVFDGLEPLDGFQNSDLFDSVNGRLDNTNGFERSEVDLMESNKRKEAVHLLEGTIPLGLTLSKTPSFLELLATKLPQGRNVASEKATQPKVEKLKASNFPADYLRIGTWEKVSKHDDHLVAKCYYAKRKLVWEVMEDGLKSKIEILWSDISAIRATFLENERGILDIELYHAPQFFHETNPQPRKHTLWQPTSDFTGGQAPVCRRHYLEFPKGTLEKHYQRLLQCDRRLFTLSRIPFPTQNSPYFSSNLCRYPDSSAGFNGLQQEFPDGLQSSCPSIPGPYQLDSPHGFQTPHLSIPGPCRLEFPHGLQSSHLNIPRPTLGPSHQIQNFGTTALRLSFCPKDSMSPMSVVDFNPLEKIVRNPIIERQRISFFSNEENIYRGQAGELPLTACANLDNFLGSYHLLSSGDGSGNPPPSNNIANHLLNNLLESYHLLPSEDGSGNRPPSNNIANHLLNNLLGSYNLLSSGDGSGNPPPSNNIANHLLNNLLGSYNLLSSGDGSGNPPPSNNIANHLLNNPFASVGPDEQRNKLLPSEVANHLLNVPFVSIGPDEQRVLNQVESMCDASNEPNPMENTGTKYTDYGYNYTMNDQVMLRCTQQPTGGADEQRVLKQVESMCDASNEPNPMENTGTKYTDYGYNYTMNDPVMLRSTQQSTGGADLLCLD